MIQTDELLKTFINLTDDQKISVINKLNNNKNTPAELISSLKWLHELSKTKTKDAIYNMLAE